METITIHILQEDVYEEVAKATDYVGTKMMEGEEGARDRILVSDDDLAQLGRFWEESACAASESLKAMLVRGETKLVSLVGGSGQELQANPSASSISKIGYEAVIEVSKSFDKALRASVQSMLRSFFIASIIGQWFKFVNKEEAQDYFTQAADMMETTERLLYSRRKPELPAD